MLPVRQGWRGGAVVVRMGVGAREEVSRPTGKMAGERVRLLPWRDKPEVVQ
ncbi:hypothetical protein ABZ777_12155 [Micromonospora parva]|uniref:hypothetical protein n=1 Tax=Micromonospora parva TaxID=1464048 RepID=UPI0033C63EE7